MATANIASNAIARQNVQKIQGLSNKEGFADIINSHYLLHKVLAQAITLAIQQKKETPELVEIFRIFADVPGVDLELNPVVSSNATSLTSWLQDKPLNIALTNGLGKIVDILYDRLGLSPNELVSPKVKLNLFQWSIYWNQPELFMKLLNTNKIDLYFQPENFLTTMGMAINQYKHGYTIFMNELLKRFDFTKMIVRNITEDPVVMAVVAKQLELAKRIMEHPTYTLDKIEKLIEIASGRPYWERTTQKTILDIALEGREKKLQEIKNMKESMKAFGEVLYSRKAPHELGPLIGNYLRVKSRRYRKKGRRMSRK